MSSFYKIHSVSSQQLKKLFQAVTLGAFAAASVAGSAITAQADPPDHAPAYGYRAHQNGDYQGHGAYHHDDDDDDDDNDEYRRGSDNRYNGNYSGGRYNNGRYNDGRYNGSYDGSYNNRYDNRYGNNNGRYNGSYTNQYQTLTGIVVNDRSGNEFTVRTSNGNTIRARAEDGEPGRLDEGDTVRLYGRYTNGVFLARNVDIVRDTTERDDRYNGRYNGSYNGGYNGNYGYNGNRGGYNDYGYGYGNNIDVNFPAVVTEVDKRNDTLRVRGDNGRTYTVRSGKANQFNKGDKVRIKGNNRNGVVYADKIEER